MLLLSSVQADIPPRYQPLIAQESLRTGIPAELLAAVIQVESSFRHKIVSPKGAQGLMQLMPATARRFGVKDAFDPAQNIRGGSQYMVWLYRRYQHWPFVLAAYNAGEGKVDRYKGIPPYRETQNYVRKVLLQYTKLTAGNTQTGRKGRVVQAVSRSADKQSSRLKPLPKKRNLEVDARTSSVFFTE